MGKTALAIRHVAFEDLGSFEAELRGRGFEIQYAEVGIDRLDAVDPLRANLVVLLGGPIDAYEEDIYPFLDDEIRLAEKRLAQVRPLRQSHACLEKLANTAFQGNVLLFYSRISK